MLTLSTFGFLQGIEFYVLRICSLSQIEFHCSPIIFQIRRAHNFRHFQCSNETKFSISLNKMKKYNNQKLNKETHEPKMA